MLKTKTDKNKPMGLADLIAAEFVGPIALRAVKADRRIYPCAIRLEPVDSFSEQHARSLGIDLPKIFFPVAAFNPQLWVEYKCYCRQRGGIVECIPTAWQVMNVPSWAPTPQATTFDLVFTPDGRGRYTARSPLTGQTILPRKEWELPKPDADGKITIPVGQAEIRPTATRTFWIAGEIGSLAHISEYQLEVYKGDEESVEFNDAARFRIAGRWISGREICGNPFANFFIEIDRKGGNAALNFNLDILDEEVKKTIGEVERWVSKELLVLFHPDSLNNRTISADTMEKILDVTDETRQEARRLVEWYQGWTNRIMSDIRQRANAGVTSMPKIEVVDSVDGIQLNLKKRLLTDLKLDELERILFQPKTVRKPKSTAKSPTTTPVKDAKATAAPAAKSVKQPVKTVTKKGSGKIAPPSHHSELPLAEGHPEAAATLKALKEQLERDSKKLATKPAEKKLSRNVPCLCGKSHVRPEGFTEAKFKTCPKVGKKTE